MKTNTTHRAALAATAAPHVLCLRAASFSDSVEVDLDKGIIRNVAVMTVGPWRGHRLAEGENEGQLIFGDAATIQSVCDLINQSEGGVKVRYKHPAIKEDPISGELVLEDDLGSDVGYLRNARIVGDACRADVYLAEYARSLPIYGDVRSYLLNKAKEDPAGFGLSTQVHFEDELILKDGEPIGVAARPVSLDAVDFVGTPAANPNGLLSRKQTTGDKTAALCAGIPIYQELSMNDLFKRILMELGLPYDCSDEAAQAFFDALTDEMKTEIQTRIKAITAATTTDLDRAAKDAATKVGQMSTKAIASAARAALAVKNPKKPTPHRAAQLSKGDSMDPKMKEFLSAKHGLAADASDEDAQKLFDSLSDEEKAACKATLSDGGDDADKTAQTAARNRVATDAGDQFLALEGKRVAQLQQLGNTLNVDKAVIQQAIADGDDVIKARKRYLTALQETCKPTPVQVRVGEDKKLAMLSAAIPDAILVRSNVTNFYQTNRFGRLERNASGEAVKRNAHEQAVKFASLSVLDMYRHYLIALGAPAEEIHMLSRPKMADLLSKRELRRHFPQVAQLAQATSDFDNILLDAQNKTLQTAYVEAPRTWTIWAKRATAPDFKNINRVQTSEVPSLTSRTEGKPIHYVTLADSKETYALAEYAGGVILTRRVLVNDDMNAFAEVPRKQGLAAARKEEDVAYAIITANAALGATTGALFNSTAPSFTKSTGAQGAGHGNLVTGTANIGSITVTTIAATEKLMLVQKGIQADAYIGVSPKFLLVPVALKAVAEQFVGSKVDPAKSNETPNPYNGKFTVVANPRLDANSTTKWYLFADPRDGVVETIEVCFLQDEPEPVLKQETDFDTDDVKYAVRHSVAAKALDFRGVAQNPGA